MTDYITFGNLNPLRRNRTRCFSRKSILLALLAPCALYFILYSTAERSTQLKKYFPSFWTPNKRVQSTAQISVQASGDMTILTPREVYKHQYNSIINAKPGTIVFGPGKVILSNPSGLFNVSSSGEIVATSGELSASAFGNLAVSSNRRITFSTTGNISVISAQGSLHFESKLAEDAERRKQAFLEKYVNCDAMKTNASLPVGKSCALKLKVANAAKKSVDFEFIQSKLEAAWQEHLWPPAPRASGTKMKTILYWAEHRGSKISHGHEMFVNAKCPETNCQLTANRDLVPPEQVDAIILNSWWIYRKQALPSRKKYVNAKMILQVLETPVRHNVHFEKYNGLVDYTMGYRKDSDFPVTNGFVSVRQWPQPYDAAAVQAKTAKKTKMAAWFVSNCNAFQSGRMTLAESLQKHGIDVDIYGRCGTFTCPASERRQCYEMLERDYKFYLSFENSLCNHYVTEKFYSILRYQVIPVTFGLGHELSGAPKDAYIDVFDFPDVKSLAEYLQYLDSNDTAYNEYFRWNQFYQSTSSFDGHERHCKICEMLVRGKEPESQYNDVPAWVSDHQCLSVKEGVLKNFIEGKPRLS